MTHPNPIKLDQSNRARAQPVGLDEVTVTDPYWVRRLSQAAETELEAQIEHCERTGRIENLKAAAGLSGHAFKGRFFNDSDVYKVLEAAAWAAPTSGVAESWIERLTEIIEKAQGDDGYLNSFFTGDREPRRWTDFTKHELYCAGHLAQAAIARVRTSGDDRLLAVARRFMDLICDRFDPDHGDTTFTSGHPEIEMALIEMARETGNDRYLHQAASFIERRGMGLMAVHGTDYGADYHQDSIPLADQDRLVGHAVRAVYLNAGAADLALEGQASPRLEAALSDMWTTMVTRQMYITGGIGSRWETEGMGNDYELPDRAYAETCAAIGSIMWNHRMLHLDLDGRYADLIERTLFNAVLVGVADDGSCYFYQNPLADDGTHRRQDWFDVACCPTNWIRLAATLPTYLYSRHGRDVWVHQYIASRLLGTNEVAGVELITDFPRSGRVRVEVAGEGQFTLWLRHPEWSSEVSIVSPEDTVRRERDGYIGLTRHWTPGDSVELEFQVEVRLMGAPPAPALQRKAAVMRGPIVYCAEATDNNSLETRRAQIDLHQTIEESAPPARPDTYPAPMLRATGQIRPAADSDDALYRPIATPSEARPVTLNLRPYALWAHDEPGPMTVFLHQLDERTL